MSAIPALHHRSFVPRFLNLPVSIILAFFGLLHVPTRLLLVLALYADSDCGERFWQLPLFLLLLLLRWIILINEITQSKGIVQVAHGDEGLRLRSQLLLLLAIYKSVLVVEAHELLLESLVASLVLLGVVKITAWTKLAATGGVVAAANLTAAVENLHGALDLACSNEAIWVKNTHIWLQHSAIFSIPTQPARVFRLVFRESDANTSDLIFLIL